MLPKGFQKIRHFGLLSNRNRKEKIAAARALLKKAAAPSSAAAPAGGAALLKAALHRAAALPSGVLCNPGLNIRQLAIIVRLSR